MTATIDANILLYASDTPSPLYEKAQRFLKKLVTASDLFCIFWPTVMAYVRLSTHPNVFDAPMTSATAIANIETLLNSPNVRLAGENDTYWDAFKAVTTDLTVRGNLVPDAQIVALMHAYGVKTIWTHDRDFRKFNGITVKDPFK